MVEDLSAAYARAAVVVNPRRFGTGLSIKSIEALACGRPLVATAAGATGLEDAAGGAFLLREDPGEFAEAVLQVLGDPGLAGGLAARGRAHAQQHNAESLAGLDALLAARQPTETPR
jgi:glycosyltransferase involved in cell wall biosynthesis